MYYWGKFRNIDTSIDPLGQEYKVVIFTGYDGRHNPYFIMDEPTVGIELIMTSSPFTVSYENEDGNIYKPYKCSTATVSFLMSNLNLDLFTNKENNILVALLKRDNNIVLNGDTYINKLTNDVVVRKRSYGLFYGFLPSEIDKECYNVEWIGYATPNTYNQNYTLVEQEFQLECQDAFSTLKYDGLPFNNLVEVRDVKTVINLVIGQLGTYKHIYYPSTLILPDIINYYNDVGVESSSFIRIIQQYRNFIEKDDEPISKIELLEAIGSFLNVSFVPFKDSVYIINYEGVAGNINNYYRYSLIENNNFFFNYREEEPEWSDSVLENLENNLELTKDCYAGDDTNITMQSVYNNFRVKCDENEVDLMPDLSNSENFEHSTPNNITASIYNNYSEPDNKNVQWLGGVISNYQQNNGVGFKNFIYKANYVDGNDIIHADYTPQTPALNPNIFLIDDTDIGSTSGYYSGCVNLKNTKIRGNYIRDTHLTYNKETDQRNNANFPNDFVFWNRNNFSDLFSDGIVAGEYNRFWNNNHQVVLEYQSPKFILTDTKQFQIKGDWMFFRHGGFVFIKTDNDGVRIDKKKLYITAQIIFTTRNGQPGNEEHFCVKSDGGVDDGFIVPNDIDLYASKIQHYIPENTVNWRVDLPLNDDEDSVKMSDPFGQWISFKNSNGDNSGIIIDMSRLAPTPNSSTNYICDVRVRIMCPLGIGVGTAQGWANSSMVRNLEFNIVDTNEIESWGYGDITTDFHNSINKNLETFEIDNKLSTNQHINKLSYNYCFKVYDNHYFLLNDLYNQATGIIGRPELLKLADIYNQYRDKTIGLNTTIWENLGITPNTRVKWQYRNFIIDRQEIDYEMNRNTVSLIEKKVSGNIPEIETKMYLENENGQTLNLNPFYNENIIIRTVESYYRDLRTAVFGEIQGTYQINSLINFYATWSDGIEAWVSIPNVLNNINVSINNNNELIIIN